MREELCLSVKQTVHPLPLDLGLPRPSAASGMLLSQSTGRHAWPLIFPTFLHLLSPFLHPRGSSCLGIHLQPAQALPTLPRIQLQTCLSAARPPQPSPAKLPKCCPSPTPYTTPSSATLRCARSSDANAASGRSVGGALQKSSSTGSVGDGQAGCQALEQRAGSPDPHSTPAHVAAPVRRCVCLWVPAPQG